MSTARCRALSQSFSRQNSKKMNNNRRQTFGKTTSLTGLMTFGTTDDKKHIMDFACTEYVEMEAFVGDCKVQAMRDGNVYITEKPKRVRGKALFREDNSTLTLGRDGRYYFVFTLPKKQQKALPEKLVRQAVAIAEKFGVYGLKLKK